MAHTLYFVDHGYQVFSFDNTGCHRSGGSDCGGMSQSVLDLDAALSFLEGQERFRDLPLLLFGHSWGGYAVTAILQFDHDVAASVSVAGYNSPVEMTFQWLLERDGPKAWLAYPYLWIFQLLRFGKNANLTALDGINSSDTPVLLLHGIADDIVDCQSTGIAARRGDISNPNVRCIFFMASGHDGHSSLYTSDDSAAYFREVRAAREALAASYGGELPQEAEWEFNETVDSFRMSGLDPSFMAWVLAFFDNAAVPEAGDAPQ